jgi:general secretion pathway protein E
MMKKNIGQVLVDTEVLSKVDLDQHQDAAKNENLGLIRYLQDKSLVTEEQLAQAYAVQNDLEFIKVITEEMADPLLLAKVPLKFLKQQTVMPIRYKSGTVLVTANPNDFQPIDELGLIFGKEMTVAVSSAKIILDALNHYYPLEGTDQMMEDLEEESDVSGLSFGEIDERDIMSSANDAPIIKLVNYVLLQASKMSASDIHISPAEKEIRVRLRVDGIMHQFMSIPKRTQGAVISRLKIMSGLNIAEKRKPQDGRIEIRVGEKRVDIRVSILPASFGENIVMRLLDKDKGFSELDSIGLSERDLKEVKKAIAQPNGIFLVSGPTGSGKTTTLYSVLHRLNDPKVNLITVEDPVEYQLQGITQVQVNPKVELTFANALRAILRQDPDIVMIGETRDQETAQIAIQAALTGHLVLSTIHTNSAPAIITRLIDMGIEPFLIASSIVAGIAQRLVRKLCGECKALYTPTPEALESLGIKPVAGKKYEYYKPVGCDECNQLGYRGRLPIFEVMAMTDDLVKLTMERGATLALRKQAEKDGMTTLIQDGIRKLEMGLTSVEEVVSVATSHGDSNGGEVEAEEVR